MDSLSIVLLCICGFCLSMALLKLINNWEKKKRTASVSSQSQPITQFTPEQLKALQTVGRLFRENYVMPINKVYEECGIVNTPGSPAQIPFEKDSDGDNVFKTLAFAVAKRHELQNLPIIEHSNNVLQINLHKNENIYHVIYGVTFYQEKTTVTNIAYSGFRWSNGPLRTGTLNVLSNEFTKFVPSDIGHLVFTNERLIFLGRQKNITKQVKLNDILYNNLYQDGVMVHIPNHKPLLFKFDDKKDYEIYNAADGLNEFVLIYNRLINQTHKEDLTKNVVSFKEKPPMLESLKTGLADKNNNPLIFDIIQSVNFGDEFSSSGIARKYNLPYSEAGKIMDQLDNLKFIMKKSEGGWIWVIDKNDHEAIRTLIDLSHPYPN